jgi:uncharacterized membrane protein YbhN (UPF0104 family)
VKVLQRILTVALVCVIFFFLIRSLIANWAQIPFTELRFNTPYLIISFLCLAIYFSLLTRGWSSIVAELGSKVPYGRAFWIVSTSQIAKYIPGGIWYTVGRVYLARTEKVKEEIGLLSVVFETFLLMLTNLIIFLISINFIRGEAYLSPFMSITFIVVILILLYPPLLNKLLNLGLRMLKKPTVKLHARYLSILNISTYFFALWIAQIAGYFFLINSIYQVGIWQLPNLATAYTLSWITGFIVLFAPGGLGVREGMMTLLLSIILPLPLAIAISFITRVWITIFEVLVFFAGLLVRGKPETKTVS